jgi:hypothetical protein
VTIDEAVKQLQQLQAEGHGSSDLRCYSELHAETYPQARFVLHKAEDNKDHYDESYGTWVEVA